MIFLKQTSSTSMTSKGTGTKKSTKSKYMQIDTGQLRYAFNMLDRNQDGKLNKDEIKMMLQNLGMEISEKIINRITSEASKNGEFCSNSQDICDNFFILTNRRWFD